jgi:DNA-binding HxlR family transcriptional regulator
MESFRGWSILMPPKVEYRLTDWGQALCPALDAMLKWAEKREAYASK